MGLSLPPPGVTPTAQGVCIPLPAPPAATAPGKLRHGAALCWGSAPKHTTLRDFPPIFQCQEINNSPPPKRGGGAWPPPTTTTHSVWGGKTSTDSRTRRWGGEKREKPKPPNSHCADRKGFGSVPPPAASTGPGVFGVGTPWVDPYLGGRAGPPLWGRRHRKRQDLCRGGWGWQCRGVAEGSKTGRGSPKFCRESNAAPTVPPGVLAGRWAVRQPGRFGAGLNLCRI